MGFQSMIYEKNKSDSFTMQHSIYYLYKCTNFQKNCIINVIIEYKNLTVTFDNSNAFYHLSIFLIFIQIDNARRSYYKGSYVLCVISVFIGNKLHLKRLELKLV